MISAKDYVPFDWNAVNDKTQWLEPCEESWYYAEKWRREGRKTILDLGCGLGRHSVFFAKHGFTVTAMDISEDALSFLKKYSKEQGTDIECVQADMESMPFEDASFDAIFSIYAAGHADTAGMHRIMNEIKRILKPGGEVFMTLCSKETWTFTESDYPRTDENTVIKTDGPEQGVPHFFADNDTIIELFKGFKLNKVRLINECFANEAWKNEKHYFIEADKSTDDN